MENVLHPTFNKHTFLQKRLQTHTHTHTRSHMRTHFHAFTYIFSHFRTHTISNLHIFYFCIHIHNFTYFYTNKQTKFTHAYTFFHTHVFTLSLSLSLTHTYSYFYTSHVDAHQRTHWKLFNQILGYKLDVLNFSMYQENAMAWQMLLKRKECTDQRNFKHGGDDL